MATAEMRAQVAGINACRKALIPATETFVKGYVLISVNQWNIDQERVILLTNRCLYRIKYDFEKLKIIRHSKVDLLNIAYLQRGYFDNDKGTQETFGVRVFFRVPEEERGKSANPFKKVQPLNTFRTLDCVSPAEGKAVMLDFSNSINDCIRVLNPASSFYINEGTLHRTNYLGFISTSANKMKVGHFEKK